MQDDRTFMIARPNMLTQRVSLIIFLINNSKEVRKKEMF
jgi:hypothetical protein